MSENDKCGCFTVKTDNVYDPRKSELDSTNVNLSVPTEESKSNKFFEEEEEEVHSTTLDVEMLKQLLGQYNEEDLASDMAAINEYMAQMKQYQTQPTNEIKSQLFKNACSILESSIPDSFDKTVADPYHPDPSNRTLYLYYVSLENDKMLLHGSFKRSFDQILSDCEKLYEFAQLHKPVKVVYVMENIDLHDVDKNVKVFMQMFGIDETRGGSYVSPVLPREVKKVLEREFKVANIQYFLDQETKLNEDNVASSDSTNE